MENSCFVQKVGKLHSRARCSQFFFLAASFLLSSVFLNSCGHVEREYRLQSWEKYRIAAEKALKKNQNKLALSMAQESVAAAESFGDTDFRLGVSLCVLGDAQRVNKRTKAAEAAYKKSIIVLENAMTEPGDNRALSKQIAATQLEHQSFEKLLLEDQCESFSHLGDLYMAQDKYADAARCFSMAAAKIQGLFDSAPPGPGDMVMQQTLMNCLLQLARATAQTDKIEQAEQSYQRAIFIAAKPGCGELARRELRDEFLKFLKEHNKENDSLPLVADVLFARYSADGSLALSEGDFTSAEIAFRNALVQAGQSVFSEQRMLQAMGNLISVFTHEGKTAEIVQCSNLASSFISSHPNANLRDYDHILEALANYYLLCGSYQLAQDALVRQLHYRVLQFGRQSKEVAVTYASLGLAACKNNNMVAAENCAQKAYRIIKSRPADRSLFYACARTSDVFLLLNSFPQVEELQKRMIAIKQAASEKGNPFVVGLQANLLVLYQRFGKRAEAETLTKQILSEIKDANSVQREGDFPYIGVALSCCLSGGWNDLAQQYYVVCQDIDKNVLHGNINDEQVRQNWLKNSALMSQRLSKQAK